MMHDNVCNYCMAMRLVAHATNIGQKMTTRPKPIPGFPDGVQVLIHEDGVEPTEDDQAAWLGCLPKQCECGRGPSAVGSYAFSEFSLDELHLLHRLVQREVLLLMKTQARAELNEQAAKSYKVADPLLDKLARLAERAQRMEDNRKRALQ